MKHGLAWSYGALDNNADRDYQITWYFHWGAMPFTFSPDYIQFVPMLWCDSEGLKNTFLHYVPEGYNGPILVANEPEFPTQCGASVDRVIEMVYWVHDHYPLAQIIAPNSHVCWFENQQPRPPCPALGERFTVEQFIDGYRAKYRVDPPIVAVGAHYGTPLYWADRLSYFLDNKGLDEVTIWWTEFNYCAGDMHQFTNWLEYMEQHPRIERYAFWSNLREDNQCALADINTRQLTVRGLTYREAGR